jgi:DNA-binding IclR family transcriptional regulator
MSGGTAEAFLVSRTMQAVELLSFQEASAPQVADVLRVHPGTSRRLLNRLVSDGWLTRSDGYRRTYTPTMRIVAMAAQLAARDPMLRAAQPIVERLHVETGAVVHLCIPSYRAALCLVHRAGGPDVRPQLRELVPAHAAAAGKALLGYRDAWRASVLSQPLERLTPETVVDPDAIEREAAVTTERGYAFEDQEFQPEVRGVAVPVRAAHGAVVASLALNGPAHELPDEAVDGTATLLKLRAEELERSLAA